MGMLIRYRENDAYQILRQLFLLNVGQLFHERKVDPCFFGNRNGKCFCSRVYMGNHCLLTNGPLCEHVCFAGKLTLFIQHFQRAQQVVRGIIRENAGVAAGIDESKPCSEGIVAGIQLRLKDRKRLIIHIVQLRLNQIVHMLTQVNQPLDALQRGSAQVLPDHHGVRAVVNVTFQHREGVVLDRRVSRNGLRNCFTFCQFRQLCFTVFTVNVFHCLGKLFRKDSTLHGNTGCFGLVAVQTFLPDHGAENHFRMLRKVAVDGNTVLSLPKMHPVRLYHQRTFPLLEEDDV